MTFPPADSLPSRLRTGRIRAAFTLVELLVVMGIIVLLLAVTGPVVRGIFSGRNVSDGLDAISGYLAYARTQAVTQNTYVIVGFYQASGSDDLQMASIISSNGTFNPANFSPSNTITPAANYPALAKMIHISNVTLVPQTGLSPQLQAKAPVPDSSSDPAKATIIDCSASPKYATNASYFSFKIATTTYSYCVIAFSPQGEALFFPAAASSVTNFSSNLPFYSQLFIGLRATRSGNVTANDVNSAAITIDGGSGDIKVYRL